MQRVLAAVVRLRGFQHVVQGAFPARDSAVRAFPVVRTGGNYWEHAHAKRVRCERVDKHDSSASRFRADLRAPEINHPRAFRHRVFL